MPLPLRLLRTVAGALVVTALAETTSSAQQSASSAPTRLRFAISFPAARSAQPLDGRIILVVSNNDKREPRFRTMSNRAATQLPFGIDVDSLGAGQEAYVDGTTFGYPLKSIADIPPGEYWVQAVLNRYTTFH